MAGISSSDAKKLKASRGGSGGGGSRSSGGSGNGGSSGGDTQPTAITSVSQLGNTAKAILNSMASPNNYNSDGTPKQGVIDRIESAYDGGSISAEEADYLMKTINK
jgi:hypothetical protein